MAIQYVPQCEDELNYWKLMQLELFVLSAGKVYESSQFVQDDPVQFPRRYVGVQAEISGFITSWISFGNRNAIIKTAERLDQEFCHNPYQWVMRGEYSKYANNHCKIYRFLSYHDLYLLGERLRRLYSDYDSMEDMIITEGLVNPVQAITNYFQGIKGIPDYSKGSACKRICMFLRWMVRRDSPVDMGLWMKLNPEYLIIPLDTHVHRIAIELGLTKRKCADMKTAIEITQLFKCWFPHDPVKGDFLLFGYGVEHRHVKTI